MNPKHKRVLHDSTPVGLPRWLRAADNAVRNPNSPAAQLYYTRVSNAHRLREKYGEVGPVVFFDYRYADWRIRSVTVDRDKRNALVCSTFCAAMHAQQRYGHAFQKQDPLTLRWLPVEPMTLAQLEEFFQEDERAGLLVETDIELKRSVKCIVCWHPVVTPR